MPNKPFKVQTYELIDGEKRRQHVKYVKVLGLSGNSISSHIGPKRLEELLNSVKPKLPKGTHLSLFGNLSGAITKEPFIDNVIYSRANENIDRKKLLKLEGSNFIIKSKGKEVEVTMLSEAGSRTYS